MCPVTFPFWNRTILETLRNNDCVSNEDSDQPWHLSVKADQSLLCSVCPEKIQISLCICPSEFTKRSIQGAQRRMVLVVNFFIFLKLLLLFFFFFFFCFIIGVFDLVHDVEAIFDLPQLLTTSGNLF